MLAEAPVLMKWGTLGKSLSIYRTPSSHLKERHGNKNILKSSYEQTPARTHEHMTPLAPGRSYHPHLTDEETKAQED